MAAKLTERRQIIRGAVLDVLRERGDWLPSSTLVELVTDKLDLIDLPVDDLGMRSLANGEIRAQAIGLETSGLVEREKPKSSRPRTRQDEARWQIKVER